MAVFKKTVLDNGVRILSEHHPESRCVVLGFWVEVGTRFEKKHELGVSHLLEHMVFKGTEKFNTFEIAKSLEAVGGDINAFTGREHTCFHTTSLKEDLDLSVEVLSQLVRRAVFDSAEYDKEKKVVQQEILMAVDDLEEYIYDLYFEKIFEGNPLGWPILGTMKSIGDMPKDAVIDYYNKNFIPENIIITASGSLDHEELVKMVKKHLGEESWGESKKPETLSRPSEIRVLDHFEKDCEQIHILGGFPAISYKDENRFNAYVVNTMLGGGMTSKLYQKIREDHGLVYSIFSMLNTFTDCGLQTIYAGTERDHAEEVIELIQNELAQLKKNGVTEDDIKLYRTQAKGQILIAAEDIESRMNSLAINEMVFGEYRSVDRVISEVEAVTKNSVNQYVEDKIKEDNLSIYLMGAKDEKLTQFVRSL